MSGRCVRSVLLLLARHPRSGDCCGARGREGKGRVGKEGRSAGGWREGDLVRALRRGEQRQHAGLCHLTPPRDARMDTGGKKAS